MFKISKLKKISATLAVGSMIALAAFAIANNGIKFATASQFSEARTISSPDSSRGFAAVIQKSFPAVVPVDDMFKAENKNVYIGTAGDNQHWLKLEDKYTQFYLEVIDSESICSGQLIDYEDWPPAVFEICTRI